MAMVTNYPCPKCGCPLTLDCGDIFPNDSLDLTLFCENDCDQPVLNAFVRVKDFQVVEDW